MKESKKAIHLSGSSLKESWAIMAAVVRLGPEPVRPARTRTERKPLLTSAIAVRQKERATTETRTQTQVR